MPTYQYACTACDHRFDAVQSFSDASLTVCPVCSGALRKVFSSVGIVFKGSGFYRTDSRAGSTVAKGESKSDSGSSAEGSSGGSSSEKGTSTSSDTKSSSGTASSGSSSSTSSGGSSSTPAAAAS